MIKPKIVFEVFISWDDENTEKSLKVSALLRTLPTTTTVEVEDCSRGRWTYCDRIYGPDYGDVKAFAEAYLKTLKKYKCGVIDVA